MSNKTKCPDCGAEFENEGDHLCLGFLAKGGTYDPDAPEREDSLQRLGLGRKPVEPPSGWGN
jgi:hypothetical protein